MLMKKKYIKILISICLLLLIVLLFFTRSLLIDNGLKLFGAIAAISPDSVLDVLGIFNEEGMKERGSAVLSENGYRNSMNELFLSKQYIVLFVFAIVILAVVFVLLLWYFYRSDRKEKTLEEKNIQNEEQIQYMHEEQDRVKQKISEYQGNIYHQLATSLSSVRVTLENIQNSRSIQENTEDALYHLDNVNALLKLLMKQEKYFEKKNNFNKEAFSLNELLDEVINECRSMITFNNIQLKQNIENDLIITGDDVWLKECFLSVLTNSIDHAGENGILDITVRKVSNSIIMDITNNGIPLTEKEMEHMFERYYSDKPGHMGIGMHMAYSVIQQHHGEIQAFNVEDGVKIHIFLPLLFGKDTYL